MAGSVLETPIFQRLLDKASSAYREDLKYAEQILLAARTAQLKRNTWAGRKEQKEIVASALTEAMLDLEAAG